MNWKTIDQKEILTDLARGSRRNVLVSPYSIPEAFRVRVENSKNDVVLEFRYISPDLDFERRMLIDGVQIEVGKESKRIYKFILESEHHKNSEDCMKLLTAAINALAGKKSNNGSKLRVERYLLTRRCGEMLDAVR